MNSLNLAEKARRLLRRSNPLSYLEEEVFTLGFLASETQELKVNALDACQLKTTQ